jgi:hypothetical protein
MLFSRGRRKFLGQALAQTEIFISFASILCNVARLDRDDNQVVKGVIGMKLYETDRRDTDLRHDFDFLTPEKGRGNVKIIIE